MLKRKIFSTQHISSEGKIRNLSSKFSKGPQDVMAGLGAEVGEFCMAMGDVVSCDPRKS